MNILFTCSARKWGGNEAWVLNAIKALSGKHNVYLAYRESVVGERFAVPTYRLPFKNEADLYTLAKLVSIIRKRNIDIIVPTKRKDYVLAGLACKQTKAKNILILGIVRDLKKTLINNLVYNKLANGIMVNAYMIKDVLLKSPYMIPEKIAVIPNSLAIKKKAVTPVPKKKPFMITSLGELSERKGFDFLLRGFARFVHELNTNNAELIIIGAGGQLENLKQLSRNLNIEHLVTFTGFQKDPYPMLLSSDVFALTSKNEGLPYAILEAALLDNAIIATKAGGIEELLTERKHCLYVKYGDEISLSHKLLELYNDTDMRKKLAANAQRTVEKHFSPEIMEQKMVSFFQKIQQGNN